MSAPSAEWGADGSARPSLPPPAVVGGVWLFATIGDAGNVVPTAAVGRVWLNDGPAKLFRESVPRAAKSFFCFLESNKKNFRNGGLVKLQFTLLLFKWLLHKEFSWMVIGRNCWSV